mmetsp:Transcript_43952/g.102772  ORF Transcript_43952/g.102772 Transcript_43952/m.102772 type:complete len:252 (+) Transcript_43952:652-1407(+)
MASTLSRPPTRTVLTGALWPRRISQETDGPPSTERRKETITLFASPPRSAPRTTRDTEWDAMPLTRLRGADAEAITSNATSKKDATALMHVYPAGNLLSSAGGENVGASVDGVLKPELSAGALAAASLAAASLARSGMKPGSTDGFFFGFFGAKPASSASPSSSISKESDPARSFFFTFFFFFSLSFSSSLNCSPAAFPSSVAAPFAPGALSCSASASTSARRRANSSLLTSPTVRCERAASDAQLELEKR